MQITYWGTQVVDLNIRAGKQRARKKCTQKALWKDCRTIVKRQGEFKIDKCYPNRSNSKISRKIQVIIEINGENLFHNKEKNRSLS